MKILLLLGIIFACACGSQPEKVNLKSNKMISLETDSAQSLMLARSPNKGVVNFSLAIIMPELTPNSEELIKHVGISFVNDKSSSCYKLLSPLQAKFQGVENKDGYRKSRWDVQLSAPSKDDDNESALTCALQLNYFLNHENINRNYTKKLTLTLR